jgi:hypothetical protein
MQKLYEDKAEQTTTSAIPASSRQPGLATNYKTRRIRGL